MRNLMGKLKFIKVKIREWFQCYRLGNKDLSINLKEELRQLDLDIDLGNGSTTAAAKRTEIISELNRINKLHTMELAQKSKIKWSIEGDENSCFFYGILNKKRNQRNIRGVMVNEVWLENPTDVKQEFFNHFRNTFDRPSDHCATVDMSFPNTLSAAQQEDLERDVSKEELKRAVWDCGIDKSPGPYWVVDADMFTGIKLGNSINLSHMFYADDAVFIGKWNDRNINTVIYVLECFYQVLGLRINMSKSKIIGVHVDRDKVQQAAGKLGCLILTSPFSYLGTKVGGIMSRVDEWKEVIDKVQFRLSKWKMKALSIGGRFTLLRSVLGSIPLFYMSIFRVPSSVLHKLESLRSHFSNGHEIGSRKATWVKWNTVLADKEKGGFGVSSFYALNRGAGSAKVLYPRLYALENHKEVNDRDKISNSSLEMSFHRHIKGGAEWVWTLDSTGDFIVASIRKLIDTSRLQFDLPKMR
nr:RNA-directed DNA polymerase, eukaryota, reverse transcriptase zinc-binding domain protein [Tanacetum cinerariifolium]